MSDLVGNSRRHVLSCRGSILIIIHIPKSSTILLTHYRIKGTQPVDVDLRSSLSALNTGITWNFCRKLDNNNNNTNNDNNNNNNKNQQHGTPFIDKLYFH